MCGQFPGRSFAAGGQYPTAIVPIRPIEPLPFPMSCCAVFILLFRMAIFVDLRSMYGCSRLQHKPAQYPTPNAHIFIYCAWITCDTNGKYDHSHYHITQSAQDKCMDTYKTSVQIPFITFKNRLSHDITTCTAVYNSVLTNITMSEQDKCVDRYKTSTAINDFLISLSGIFLPQIFFSLISMLPSSVTQDFSKV